MYNLIVLLGKVAEWLCSGLQSRGRRFDSDPCLDFRARVAELVDATDLKSVEIFLVPVRVRPWAPRILSFFESKSLKAIEEL